MFASIYVVASVVSALIASIAMLIQSNRSRRAIKFELEILQGRFATVLDAGATAECLVSAAESAAAKSLSEADVEVGRRLEAAQRSGWEIIAGAQVRANELIDASELASAARVAEAEKEASVLLMNAVSKNKDLDVRLQWLNDEVAAVEFSKKSSDLIVLEAERKSQVIIDDARIMAELILEEANSKVESIAGRARVEVEDVAFEAAGYLSGLSSELDKKASEIENLKQQYIIKKELYDRLVGEVAIFDERLAFAEMGVYEPHFDFTDSEQFKVAIQEVRSEQKDMVYAETAALCDTEWTVDGSLLKGEAMTKRNIKLTLRAFNGECDAAVSNVRWNNVNAMLKRIDNARRQIDKLNASNKIYISNEYCELKVKELRLTYEYREKQKYEREERAEQARAAREEQMLIREMEEAEREEARYRKLLEKARQEAAGADGLKLEAYAQQIALLEKTLSDVHAKVIRAQSMAEMTKSGWVYIISNVGSFGPDTVKIGLTRRLDPTDRVRELGAASVPFRFDTHAMIYSDEAPALERALHLEFSNCRVNASNLRKEFFRVSIDEVEAAVRRLAPNAPFFRDIEAQEYHETLALRNARLQEYAFRQANVFPDSL